MKYLKLFEADSKKNHINWEMIEDIKDMSLEYLDEGFTLNIIIIEKSYPIVPSNFFINIEYNHRGEIKEGDLDKYDYISEYKFGYSISLMNKSYDNPVNINKTNELMDRIRYAYPNEIFKKWN